MDTECVPWFASFFQGQNDFRGAFSTAVRLHRELSALSHQRSAKDFSRKGAKGAKFY
jgi:hypothetical protein